MYIYTCICKHIFGVTYVPTPHARNQTCGFRPNFVEIPASAPSEDLRRFRRPCHILLYQRTMGSTKGWEGVIMLGGQMKRNRGVWLCDIQQ